MLKTMFKHNNYKKVLIFDIDGTVLLEGQNLNDRNPKNSLDDGKHVFLELFQQLVKKNYFIVFITGNDFHKQKPRVLLPILEKKLGTSVICFSDGGSRLFSYNKNLNDYLEIREYSRGNEINEDLKQIIIKEFNSSIVKFISCNKTLKIPDIDLFSRTINHTELIIQPLKPSFYKSSEFIEFTNVVYQEIEKLNPLSQIKLSNSLANALIIRTSGKHADEDVNKIRRAVNDILYRVEYANISEPELEVRGGDDYISQIAIKPFKRKDLRTKYLQILKKRLNRYKESSQLSIMLGGRSTIDIQLENVNKKKAVEYIIDKANGWRIDPTMMVYFGDDFMIDGNDLPIALMPKSTRPSLIINVGNRDNTAKYLFNKKGIIHACYGPQATTDYLEFLLTF